VIKANLSPDFLGYVEQSYQAVQICESLHATLYTCAQMFKINHQPPFISVLTMCFMKGTEIVQCE
jgi:hypothetical protein